jgi:hypothetical protein
MGGGDKQAQGRRPVPVGPVQNGGDAGIGKLVIQDISPGA